MVVKSSDLEDNESSDGEGLGRFAIMGGGILRGGGGSNKDSEQETDSTTRDDAGFIKNISRRLSFRKDPDEKVNGYQVESSGRSSGFLRRLGFKSREKTTEEQIALLQKDQELNRKKQQVLAQQMRREGEREIKIKAEEERIAKELAKLEIARQREEAEERKMLAKLEAEKQKEQEKRQKEMIKLEAERKRDEERRRNQEMKKESAAAEEKASNKNSAPQSSAAKFFSNVWNTTTSAFSRDEEEWIPLIKKTRIEPGEYIPVQIKGLDLLVVASRDGKVHCLANSCSHMGTPLETGRLVSMPKEDADGKEILTKTNPPKVQCEDCIVCPLHQTAFSLETGEVRGEWCPYPPVLGPAMGRVKKTSPVAVFDIRTKGKWIEVRINTPLNS